MTAARVSPTAFHAESLCFEQGVQAVGEFTLQFEARGFRAASAAEGGFEFVQQHFEPFGRPCRGESLEDDDGLAATMGGFTPHEQAVAGRRDGRRVPRRGRGGNLRSKARRRDVQRREGRGPGFGSGCGGYAFCFFAGHGGQRSQRFLRM